MSTDGEQRPRKGTWRDWIGLLRPAQWTKNGMVLVAYFFARWDPGQHAHALGHQPFLISLLALADFCLIASGVYILNDVLDREADARHPVKRLRPIAAGKIAPSTALLLAAALLVISIAAAWLLHPNFGWVVTAYLLLQIGYSCKLKQVAILDVFMIALGFVLRAIAGAAVIDVRISPWLLLCAFLLALFLGLCKRRHEKRLLAGSEIRHRQALAGYTEALLDQLIAIVAASTVIAYALYTLNAETVARFGTNGLGFTIPFVMFGIFRYLDLVYNGEAGGRPEQILLTDRILIGTILLYLLAAATVFLLANHAAAL
jgi:4-hydroxybenzoate polyprenyltransferase